MEKTIIGIVVCAVVFGGAGYYAGKKFGAPERTMFRGEFAGAAGGPGGMRGASARGFNMTAGEIIAKDETSITVKMQDGSTKIVLLGGSTEISKQASGTQTDLSVGTQVAVMGASNQDGSMTAESVQIRPAGFSATSTRMRQE